MKAVDVCHCTDAERGNRRAQAFCATGGSRLWASAEKEPPVYSLRIGTAWINDLGAVRPP